LNIFHPTASCSPASAVLDMFHSRSLEVNSGSSPKLVVTSGNYRHPTFTNESVFMTAARELPLVLIHAMFVDFLDWEPVLEPLSQSHRVIAVDLPSFGLSSKPRRDTPPSFLSLRFRSYSRRSGSAKLFDKRHRIQGFSRRSYLLGLRRSRWREPRFFRRCVKRMGVPVKSNLARNWFSRKR
jgi:pimeloyl-ACP methyl ester carboxylesterase